MSKEFKGIIPPMVTPLTKEDGIDENSLRNLTSWLIEKGVHGILTLGGAGEIKKFSESERNKIAKIVIDEANGKVPILVGTSHFATNVAVKMSKDAEDMGADGLVLIEPWGDLRGEIYGYYKKVNDNVETPMCLYTHHLSVSVIKKCAELENLKYIKEGNQNLRHLDELVIALGKDRVFAGSTALMWRQMSLGLKGAVLGSHQIWPEASIELYNLIMKGDLNKAREIYYEKQLPLVEACSLGGWHANAIKAGLKAQGVISYDGVRGPSLQMDENSKKDIIKFLNLKGLIEE
jgi:4-hydroxy-tetrahydrodipicolinate synthase